MNIYIKKSSNFWGKNDKKRISGSKCICARFVPLQITFQFSSHCPPFCWWCFWHVTFPLQNWGEKLVVTCYPYTVVNHKTESGFQNQLAFKITVSLLLWRCQYKDCLKVRFYCVVLCQLKKRKFFFSFSEGNSIYLWNEEILIVKPFHEVSTKFLKALKNRTSQQARVGKWALVFNFLPWIKTSLKIRSNYLDLSFLLSSWIKFNFQCIFLLDGSTFFDKNWNLSSMLLLLLLKDHFLFQGKNFFNLFKKELFKKTLLLHTGGEEVFEQFFFSNNFCK